MGPHLPAEAKKPPAAPKPTRPRGTVYVTADRCKGCGFCIAFCPPKVLAFSVEFNRQGYHPPFLEDVEGCTGCDLCGLYCPDFAIYGVMLKSDGTPRRPPALIASESSEGAAP